MGDEVSLSETPSGKIIFEIEKVQHMLICMQDTWAFKSKNFRVTDLEQVLKLEEITGQKLKH